MRILVQVVSHAEVKIESKLVSSIDKGYLIFVSFTHDDTLELIDKMVDKLMKTRFFPDDQGKTNLSISDVNGEILSVSQFTLYGSLKKCNRPSFTNSMEYNKAKEYYDYFNNKLSNQIAVKTGEFGADMQINLSNEGPFTVMLDSNEIF